MYPIDFKQDGDRICFIYSDVDWKNWNERGKTHGDVGPLLVGLRTESRHLIYKTYGTIERPSKEIGKMVLIHCEPFDGPWREPKWYVNEAKKVNARYWEQLLSTAKFQFTDMTKD